MSASNPPATSEAEQKRVSLHPVNGLNEAAQEYLRAHLDPKTTQKYERELQKFSQWLQAQGTSLEKATDRDVANWLAQEAKDRHLAGSTVAKKRSAMSKAFEMRSLPNPTKSHVVSAVLSGVQKSHPTKPVDKSVNLSPFLNFLQGLGSNEDLDQRDLLGKIVALMELLGMRVADLLTLRVDGIQAGETEHEMILKLLPKERKKTHFVLQRVAGWPEKPEMCPHCLLQEWMKPNRSYQNKARKPSQLVFTKQATGKALSAQWLLKSCAQLMARAGLPAHFKTHSLRGAAPTRAVEAGLGLGVVLAQFRWSTAANTLQRHYLEQSSGTAASLFETVVKGAGHR